MISWPDTGQELLLWAHLLVLWALANYTAVYDPSGYDEIRVRLEGGGLTRWRIVVVARSVVAASVALIITGMTLPALVLAVTVLSLSLLLPFGRMYSVGRGRMWGAEWEISLNGLFAALTAIVIGLGGLGIEHALIVLPLSNGRLAVILFATAAVLFAVRGGTHVVRGVLDKVGTVPRGTTAANSTLDVEEYNRGRLIGNLERLLLMSAVVLHAYEALALLIAAKGLVRMDDLKDREFAEYFLIGTLMSLFVAFILGLLLQAAIAGFWQAS